MEIQQFDIMKNWDQTEYESQLILSVTKELSTDPDQLARLKRFFSVGSSPSGIGQFEMNLALARIADLDMVAKNPNARRLEVEDVMYVTLVTNGIVLPKGFRPVASNFQPKYPMQPSQRVNTKEDAIKVLEVTRKLYSSDHTFRSESTGLSDEQKGIAFFIALIAIAMAADIAVGTSGGTGRGSSGGLSPDMSTGRSAPSSKPPCRLHAVYTNSPSNWKTPNGDLSAPNVKWVCD